MFSVLLHYIRLVAAEACAGTFSVPFALG